MALVPAMGARSLSGAGFSGRKPLTRGCGPCAGKDFLETDPEPMRPSDLATCGAGLIKARRGCAAPVVALREEVLQGERARLRVRREGTGAGGRGGGSGAQARVYGERHSDHCKVGNDDLRPLVHEPPKYSQAGNIVQQGRLWGRHLYYVKADNDDPQLPVRTPTRYRPAYRGFPRRQPCGGRVQTHL